MALEEEQLKWLEEDTRRIVLVEAAYNTGEEYLFCNNDGVPCNSSTVMCNSSKTNTVARSTYFSNAPYVSISDSVFENALGLKVKNIAYNDVLIDIPSISSKIDSSVTIGNLSILNTEGEYDSLLNKAWEGHPIKIYIGDPEWDRRSYIPVFEGVIDSLLAPNMDKLSISVKDKKDLLDTGYTDTIITDSYISGILQNATKFVTEYEYPLIPDEEEKISIKFEPDKAAVPEATLNTLVPTCLGKCYNIEPVLVDKYNHVFMIHGHPITAVTAVKSKGNILDPNGRTEIVNGVEIQVEPGYEVDEGIGCIRLLNNDQSTTITCDVESSATPSASYTLNSASWIIERLLLNKTLIPWDQLRSLDFPNTSELGIYYKEEQSIADTMTSLMNSVGGFYRYNRDGILELKQVTDPKLSVEKLDIVEDLIEVGGMSLASVEVPNKKLSLGYGKNWTVLDKSSQASILYDEGITAESERLANEYSTLVFINEEVKNTYPLAKDRDLIETTFYNKDEAQEELDRRSVLRSVKRYIFKVNTLAPTLKLLVGDVVQIISSRFNFNAGKKVLVVGVDEKLTSNRTAIEVWS